MDGAWNRPARAPGVKCAACQAGLTYPAWTITITGIDGTQLTSNLHRSCVVSLIGRPHRAAIEEVAERAGWEQPPLPHFTDRAR